MAKNFKSSIKNNNDIKKPNSNVQSAAKKANIDKSTVDKYSNMNENQLMSEMVKIANTNKANGTLNDKELEKFYSQMSPMLTNEQRKKLRALINSLK